MAARIAVKLGPHWVRFAQPREGVTFLGTIEQGAGIGALAQTAEGGFVQLNGDLERKLNTSAIKAALRAAEARFGRQAPRRPAYVPPKPPSGPAPTVVVKRKRVWAAPVD